MLNPVCMPCNKIMKAYRTGVTIDFGNNYVRHGDVLQCPKCETQIVTNVGQGYHSPIEAQNAYVHFDPLTLQ